jgi:hypothetical protein
MSVSPTSGRKVSATTRPNTAQRAPGHGAERVRRPWPVTANALLLLLESLGFGLMAVWFLGPLGMRWPFTPDLWTEHRGEVLLGFGCGLLGVLALASAIGFLRVARGAWLLAVLVQGLNLALALVLYFESRPAFVYGMMVYGIVMVLYLHQVDVQAAFRPDMGGEPGEAP